MALRLVLVFMLAACSVEGRRQVGDTCLNDRECVAPLRCELTAGGSMRCVTPTRVDAAVPDVPPGPDVVDVPAAPTDVQAGKTPKMSRGISSPLVAVGVGASLRPT